MRVMAIGGLLLCAVLVCSATRTSAGSPIPTHKPHLVQDERTHPFAQQQLNEMEEEIRSASGPEQYKILLFDDAGVDPTAFIEAVWAEWAPEPNTVLFVVTGGGAIRFYLGNHLTAWGIGTNSVLRAIRGYYVPALSDGGVAVGLLALVREIHAEVLSGRDQAQPPSATSKPTAQPPETPIRGLWPPDWGSWLRLPWLPSVSATAGLGLLVWAWVDYRYHRRRWQALRDRGNTK